VRQEGASPGSLQRGGGAALSGRGRGNDLAQAPFKELRSRRLARVPFVRQIMCISAENRNVAGVALAPTTPPSHRYCHVWFFLAFVMKLPRTDHTTSAKLDHKRGAKLAACTRSSSYVANSLEIKLGDVTTIKEKATCGKQPRIPRQDRACCCRLEWRIREAREGRARCETRQAVTRAARGSGALSRTFATRSRQQVTATSCVRPSAAVPSEPVTHTMGYRTHTPAGAARQVSAPLRQTSKRMQVSRLPGPLHHYTPSSLHAQRTSPPLHAGTSHGHVRVAGASGGARRNSTRHRQGERAARRRRSMPAVAPHHRSMHRVIPLPPYLQSR
jgi:hypothetical protein